MNLFLIIFFSVGVILAAAISFFYQLQTESYVGRLKENERLAVKAEYRLIDYIFNQITSDLVFLSREHALHAFLNQGGKQNLKIMEQEYLGFARAKKAYDQVRFLDDKGMEIVRVNYNRGEPLAAPRATLQNKAKRYYFSDTFALGPNQVFVSPLDLNIEHGRIERPLKPMIRFGIAVFDQDGRKRGVVLLNFLGARILRLLKEAGEAMYGQPLLINRDGYWLLGPKPQDAWGFMLSDRKGRTLFNQFPLSARIITEKPKGQFINDEGMFTFTDIHPLQRGQLSSTGAGKAFADSHGKLAAEQYHWKLVSHIGHDELRRYSFGLLFNLSLLGAALFLLTGVASWLIAASITRKRIHRAELFNLAHFDTLTGLPNRSLCFDRLTKIYEASKRYGRSFAVMYVDLDDFKAVNDTLGHSAGDSLLTQVSRRMQKVVRKSDTVGRMGGDEFMIILSEISQYADVEPVAQKLLNTVSMPFTLGQNQATVGASIGASVFPTDSDDLDQLINLADQAMYACKSAGKNLFKTARSLKPGE